MTTTIHPTKEEIAQRALEIQAKWDEDTRQQRAGTNAIVPARGLQPVAFEYFARRRTNYANKNKRG